MGWSFSQDQTKSDLIKELTSQTADNGTMTCTAHKTYGNHLWAVFTNEDKSDGFINLFLLQSQKDYGWGYKGMCESMHPYYYNCPLEFLDLVPVASESWREKVLETYSKKNAGKENQKVVMKALRENSDSLIVLPKGYSPRFFSFAGFVKQSVFGYANGRKWKITPKYLKVATVQPPDYTLEVEDND